MAPKGLIKSDELSAECGLIELVGTQRLITRKRAPYREIESPESLYRYILMCRSKITRDWQDDGSPRTRILRAWLDNKEENKQLCYEVSKAVKEHVHRVEIENERLKTLCGKYEDVRQFMKSLDMTDSDLGWRPRWNAEDRYRKLTDLIPDTLKKAVKDSRDAMANLDKQIELLNGIPAKP